MKRRKQQVFTSYTRCRSNLQKFFSCSSKNFKVLIFVAFVLLLLESFFGTEIGRGSINCQLALREAAIRNQRSEAESGGFPQIESNDGGKSSAYKLNETSKKRILEKYHGAKFIVHQLKAAESLEDKDDTETIELSNALLLSGGRRSTKLHYPLSDHDDVNSKYGKPVFGKNIKVIHNAVPKTASRSLETSIRGVFSAMGLGKMCVNIPPYLEGTNNQTALTEWYKMHGVPSFIRGHVRYAPTSHISDVIYINLVRDPIDRLISHFYFDYFGDTKGPKNGSRIDLKHCIKTPHIQCHDRYTYFKAVTLNAFCGYQQGCETPSNFSLKLAKENIDRYMVVGITEDMESILKVLEMLQPSLLSGITKKYKIMESELMTKFKTTTKIKPDEELIALLTKELELEYIFYNYVKMRFNQLKRNLSIS